MPPPILWGGGVSNFYLLSLKDKQYTGFKSAKSLFFINEERVQRICFYTLDFLDFAELFYTHTNILDSNAIIEITSKNPHLLENDLFHLGFYTIAKQQRISSNNAAFCFSKDSPAFSFMPMSDQELESCIATERDSKQIYTKLREVFDSTTGHLQNIDELKISIHNKQFFILKDSHNNITSLLQAIINPKSFYINQIFNFSKPSAYTRHFKRCISTIYTKWR